MATKQTKNIKNESKKKKAPPKSAGKKQAQESSLDRFMPYILGALGFVFGLFFIMNAVSYGASPDEHLVGPIGYYFCQIFFGIFGWGAFLLPVLLVYLAVSWNKNKKENSTTLRCVLSAVLILLLSAVIHVFVCSGNADLAEVDLVLLYETGAIYQSGGVLCGLLGIGLYWGLKPVGTIIVSIVVFPLLVMLLIGVTPADVIAKIKEGMDNGGADQASSKRGKDKTKQSAAKTGRGGASAQSAEDEDADGEDDQDAGDDENDRDGDDGYVPFRQSVKKSRHDQSAHEKKTTRKVSGVDVDTSTGEVLDDDGDEEDDGTVTGQPRPLIKTFSADEAAPADRVSAAAEDDDQGGEDLYVPRRSTARDRRERHGERAAQRESAAYAEEEDGFYADDRHHRTDTMEISMDDDGADELSAPPRRSASRDQDGGFDPGKEKEKLVVVVRAQDHTAVHSTVDNQVDGLADEEVVLPSGTGEAPVESKSQYSFPPIDLLTRGSDKYEADEEEIARNTETLREVLESFHIRVKEVACSCGPTITRFEVKPDQGVRVRSIANLVDDIALGLAKSGVRIEAPIPGKAAVGIEVPTEHPSTVYLRNLIESSEFQNHKSRIASCLGADVSGRPVIFDINKMPHLLVAGATGMGKSVCINSIIMSILYKATPEEVKLILIDPKKVEFTMYRDLPHLYAPIVSDPKKAAGCLNSAVNEMERRFELIEEEGVRNIAGYNEVIADDPTKKPMPRIVIIIDEFADLMMTASQEVETAVCRLAQKARAAGIHIIIGTQRPSVDVITGLIKANIPSRIAFTVASSRDSMTILDMGGAEKLIGRGDMLYAPVGASKPMRVQGTFVSDGEVERVVTYIKEHNNRVAFDENFVKDIELEAAKCGVGKKKGGDMGAGDFDALGGGDDSDEKMFWAAVEVAVENGEISTSLMQRRLRIGFGKASRYIDRMEEMGFVTPKDGAKPRKTLITPSDLAEIRVSGRTESEGQG